MIAGLLSLSATGQETVAGEWMLTIDDQFGPNIMRLSLVVAGEKLTGTAGNRSRERFAARPSSSKAEISRPADRSREQRCTAKRSFPTGQ
jgi:hypothetical protein